LFAVSWAESRVARWHILNPKILIWVNFGGLRNARFLYVFWPFGLFYGNLVYFVAIWYIFWLFGLFFPVMVSCTKKNLATLAERVMSHPKQLTLK
jgi:hypothetical protein